MMQDVFTRSFILVLASVLMGCGGGAAETVAPAQISAAEPRAQALAVNSQASDSQRLTNAAAPTVSAEMVLNWAEYKMPDLFPPAAAQRFPSVEFQGITYNARAYTGTWGVRYLGITLDGRVFGLGDFTGNALQSFDTIAFWSSQVLADRCRVDPAACRQGTRISLGGSHTCAIRGDRRVACWGRNLVGELGNGTNTQSLTPTEVVGLSGVAEVAAGTSHTCALRTDGTVLCWGGNVFGSLGDGTAIARNTPVAVRGLFDAQAVAAGSSHTCAIRADRTVVCWGYNAKSQLGSGAGSNSLVPVPVTGLTDAVQISAGGSATCALRSEGTVACWGDNSNGQAGDGRVGGVRSTPITVAGLNGVTQISVGGGAVCALKNDRTVVCWGSNGGGTLGDGTFTDRMVPTPVRGVTDASAVAISSFGCAVRSGGAVNCWGASILGSLGNAEGTGSLVPVPAVGLNGATAIAVSTHSCAITNTGVAFCWGSNTQGQLGDGTTVNRNTPVPVAGGALFLN